HTGACCSKRFITSSNIPSYPSFLNISPGYQVCSAKTLKGLGLSARYGHATRAMVTVFTLQVNR
ncbi:hypothetical protein VOM14_27795, partial [Paraburkholderia sp. MPAMCS5]|uniref:hypothetical protein n=1 Tax=Paraburkholderia sp. MPAMCS5 TaxID=3112563 RepID=UPI002E17C77B|nr:hypothetical protein [Paraburkholderia sp. MPAMCS5]